MDKRGDLNYLAHIFLSGTNSRVQIGNFIGDAVKGAAYKKYPPEIAEGILLHRKIDDYTDKHPAIKETIQLLRPHFGRYSGVVLDIYFDYLLASRFSEFSTMPLKRYTRRFYWAMISNRRYLPMRMKRFMWHFICTDRLSKYATPEGIRDSLSIMVHYGRMDIDVDKAAEYLVENEQVLWEMFKPFFGELQHYFL